MSLNEICFDFAILYIHLFLFRALIFANACVCVVTRNQCKFWLKINAVKDEYKQKHKSAHITHLSIRQFCEMEI